jgi:hypothetical protein
MGQTGWKLKRNFKEIMPRRSRPKIQLVLHGDKIMAKQTYTEYSIEDAKLLINLGLVHINYNDVLLVQKLGIYYGVPNR